MNESFSAPLTTDRESPLPGGTGPGTVIAKRYRVKNKIAEGGMATVFLAEDLKHGRDVAVKVLHESLAHTIGIQRFLREIEVISRLQHPHLLTLIDSGATGGLPYYVMPFIEAQSLRETIAEHGRLSLDQSLRVACEVADGLSYAHQHGVVHRDIKPSNILMSGGHAVVADFGIATAIHNATESRLTLTGTSLGSPTYMSPEQAAGESDVDARSDVYSLACVLYEMLAGQPPIDFASMQHVVTRKLTGNYTKLREHRPDIPATLEAVIHQALTPERTERFASIEDFATAIKAALPVERGGISTRVKWAAAAAALVIVATLAVMFRHQRQVVWATQQIAEINRLAQNSQHTAAFNLAQLVIPIIPGDTTLRRIRPMFTDFIRIVTDPAGARVFAQRIEGTDSSWKDIGTTPLDSVPMPKFFNEPGYRLRIERSGFEPVNVLHVLLADFTQTGRGPPPIDTLVLDTAGGPAAGMARIRGFPVVQGRDTIQLADYHIGKYEVTNREYMKFVEAGGYSDRKWWTEPMVRDGRTVTWEEGMAEFRDRTGLPGPGLWNGGRFPPGEEDFPVGGVSYYEAAAYARFAGKQLPTSVHWAGAALRSNRETGWITGPTDNVNGSQARRVGMGISNVWGLFDAAGNVREWCVNPIDSGRLTRGATWEDETFHVGHLIPRPEFDRSPTNGLRLALYTDADTIIRQVSRRIARNPPRDFRNFVAVSDAEFAGYRRMYDYDRLPLDARLEHEGEGDYYRWQKVSFTAAYKGPRMAAYLLIPRNASPPFEPIVFWPPGNAADRAIGPELLASETFVGFIVRSGRALVMPLFYGSYERDNSTFSMARSPAVSSIEYRDLMVHWINDFRRTVDYIETRADMKADRIGYYGLSGGGAFAPLALAMEPRIKAAVLNTAGYSVSASVRPEVHAANYAPRVRAPTLMLGGQYDIVFPYETSQVPFFKHLGTPDKDHKVSPRSHILAREAIARDTRVVRPLPGNARLRSPVATSSAFPRSRKFWNAALATCRECPRIGQNQTATSCPIQRRLIAR
jgi:serine/threonine protein kinase/dienelactone hydrolase